jgi:acyl-CoA hydrolase/RimJ/RimL family protein N-acetyltransferase
MSTEFNWQEKYSDKISSAAKAMELINSGDTVFIGTGCAAPQHLVKAMVEQSSNFYDVHIVHLLTKGEAPYADEKFRDKFKLNSLFIDSNVREAVSKGIGDYTPMFLSEIPHQFETGRLPLDVALVSVTPPDINGLCSFGVSIDIVKSAASNAKYVVAQVNENMPRTHGSSYIHASSIDVMVPFDEAIIPVEPAESNDTLRKIGENLAKLVEDGSTIECGIGRIPQAMAEFLHEKKDLGIHTEMIGDWIIDLIDCGAVTCNKKTINNGKVVVSFAMGSQKLYDFIDDNPFFEFHPTEYVNDPFVIAQHDKMIGINVGLEIDLTGQVCSDSLGHEFYSGVGGQVDFVRGCSRSRGGKAIITMPSTAKGGTISRIVPNLTAGAGVVTSRADVHYVVTEYGTAYLHGKSIRERVMALVNIAHPKFRNELIQFAKEHNYIHPDQIEMAWETVEYPEDIEEYGTLRDGTELFFRPVKPTDESALSEMLYSLSSKSVEKRFFTHTKTFPHRDIQKLTNVDYLTDLAVVGVVPGLGGEEVVAIAQYFMDPKTKVAEVAFIVQDEWQDKGMGSVMLNYITRVAAKRGVKGFYATVLPDNKAMLNMFYNCGFKVKTEFDGDAYQIKYDIR